MPKAGNAPSCDCNFKGKDRCSCFLFPELKEIPTGDEISYQYLCSAPSLVLCGTAWGIIKADSQWQ